MENLKLTLPCFITTRTGSNCHPKEVQLNILKERRDLEIDIDGSEDILNFRQSDLARVLSFLSDDQRGIYSLPDINTESPEGKLLIVAIAYIGALKEKSQTAVADDVIVTELNHFLRQQQQNRKTTVAWNSRSEDCKVVIAKEDGK